MKLTALHISIKTLLWSTLAAVFVFGVFGTSAYAQTEFNPENIPDPIDPSGFGVTPGGNVFQPSGINTSNGPTNFAPVGGSAAEGNAAANAVNQNAPNANPQDGAPLSGGDINRTHENPSFGEDDTTGWFYSFLVSVGGIFTWVGGGVLDYAVGKLVLGMGDMLTSNVGVAVNNLWEVIRDVFNILFIFALIWIGLQTIISSNDSSLKKLLGGLIVAALLINFSLFITKAIVDFSNIAATQIYGAFELQPGDIPDSALPNAGEFQINTANNSGEYNISAIFVQNLRLSSFASELVAGQSTWVAVTYGFLMMILLIIAGFVFLAGGILLIYRFVALIIYMIFSPAMFLGLIFAKFKGLQDKWWRGFLANAFVAPAYLFMLYICASIFTGLSGADGIEVGTFAEGFSSDAIADGRFAIFLYFGVMVAFLIAATRVAGVMGAAGADSVMKVGEFGANKLRGAAVGAVAGGAALGYRSTLGKAAGGDLKAAERYNTYLRNGKKDTDKKNLKFGDGLSYRTAQIAGGFDTKRGMEKLEAARDYRAMGGKSIKDVKESKRYLKGKAVTGGALNELEAKLNFEGTTDQKEAKAQEVFADMSSSQLVEIAKSENGSELLKSHAHLLTDSHMKAIRENDDINDSATASFAFARKDKVEQVIKDGKLKLKDAGKDQLSALGVSYLREPKNAIQLTEDKIKSLDVVDAYKNEIRAVRKTALTDVVVNNKTISGISQSSLAKFKPSDIAELPDEVFTATGPEAANIKSFLGQLPVSAYVEISRKKNKAVQSHIRTHLEELAKTNEDIALWLKDDRIGKSLGK